MRDKSFIEQLGEYQKKVNDWFEFQENKQGGEFNREQNTTVKFIIPLLEMLGWDPLSSNDKDVEFEYHLRDKKHKTRHVDVALYLHAKNPKIPKILIEVKPIKDPNKNDMRGPTLQVFRDYLRAGKVTYGILTNGAELIVFDRRFVRHDYNKARILFSLKWKDFLEFSDVLWLLSKDMVKNGTFDKLARVYHSDEYWKKWWDPLKDMIKNRRFDKLTKIYQSKEYWKEKTSDKKGIEYLLPLVFAKKRFLTEKDKKPVNKKVQQLKILFS